MSIFLLDKKKVLDNTLPEYYLYCQRCSCAIEFEDIELHDRLLKELKNIKFQPLEFKVIVNGVCEKCNKGFR